MKKLSLVEALLGKDKSWQIVSKLVLLGFVISAVIIFFIPENILLIFSSFAITPSVASFVKCSEMKVQVAAYFNLMSMYSIMIFLVMSVILKFDLSGFQKIKHWRIPIALILLFLIYFVLVHLEPSCVAENPARSARRLDRMINSPFYLAWYGAIFVNFIGALAGVCFLIVKTFFITKD